MAQDDINNGRLICVSDRTSEAGRVRDVPNQV
jgi:hypothetical protein